jgi:hypothetical protein
MYFTLAKVALPVLVLNSKDQQSRCHHQNFSTVRNHSTMMAGVILMFLPSL